MPEAEGRRVEEGITLSSFSMLTPKNAGASNIRDDREIYKSGRCDQDHMRVFYEHTFALPLTQLSTRSRQLIGSGTNVPKRIERGARAGTRQRHKW